MENARQQGQLYKKIGLCIIAGLIVLLAVFLRGKVNVHAAETDDITVTKYVNGKKQGSSYMQGTWVYTVGDSINLSIKVDGISDTTNLKYQWKYAGEVVSESIGGDESSVTIVKKCGENSPNCIISNGEEVISWTSFTLEDTETLNISDPQLFVDGQDGIEATDGDEYTYYIWDDSIELKIGQQLKIKLNIKSDYGSISYKWYGQNKEGWYEDEISEEDGGHTDTITVEKKKYSQERYLCEVTDGNQQKFLYITIPEVKTLSIVQKANGEACGSNLEGMRGDKYVLEVEAQSTYKDENGKGNITYQWYMNVSGEIVEIEGETKPKLEVEVQTKVHSYECKVFDGNSEKEIWFSVDIKKTLSRNICTVLFEGEEYFPGSAMLLSISKGTKVRLKSYAESSLGTVNYQWYDSKHNAIPASEGGNTSAINIKKSTQGEETYYCTVSDGNMEEETDITLGGEDTLKFKSQINGKENTSLEDSYVAKEGEKVILSIVDIVTSYDEGMITYEWFKDSEPVNNNGSILEITKESGEEYYTCKVSDGNITHTASFYLTTQGCNHKWLISEKKKATCTEDGEREKTCEYCEVCRTENIPALGHKWDEGIITKQPSTTEEGILTYHCKNDGCKETKIEKIAKLPKKEESSTKPSTGGTKPSSGNKVPSTEAPKKNTGTTQKTLKVGTKITDKRSKAVYKVTGKNTVQYIKASVKNVKTVNIPVSITVNKAKYQVNSIAAKALKGNKKLKKVVIPASVRSIGTQAFAGCKNLKNIVIQTSYLTKKNVGAGAFKGISAKAVIKVPKKQFKAYQKLLKAKGVSQKAKIRK